MSLSSGDTLNQRYQIKDVIGRGGYGAVYCAFDAVLQQPCAIKENLNTTPEAQRQFEREAVILAGLRHTNLPRVFDYFFLADQGQYLVMDFVDGQSLQQILETRTVPLDQAEALLWIKQVCQALTYLHRQNPPIIHRDIKPQNIIITPEGRTMVVDFGLSKVYTEDQKTSVGAQGATFGYAPPEQYGQGRTDARSDVYALGATLYAMLTGQCPPDAIRRLMAEETLAPPRYINPHISPQVEQAIEKAMAPTTSERFQSVAAFQQALSQAPPTVPASRVLTRPNQRARTGLLLSGGVAVMLLLGVATTWGTGMRWFTFNAGVPVGNGTPIGTTPTPTGPPLAAGIILQSANPTFTPQVSSAMPIITATPTPIHPSPEIQTPVQVSALRDMNIRSGPGTQYPIIGEATLGDSATVQGRTADNAWFQIEYPPGSGDSGWVFAELVEIEGNFTTIAVAAIPTFPATPTPSPAPTVTPTSPATSTPLPSFQFTPAGWFAQSNSDMVYFRGIIQDEASNRVNGYSIFADNGSWSVLSHPTGASHHYPNKSDGEWDIVLYDPDTAGGSWTLTVVKYECPNFAQRFDAQCKQFSRLSDDIRIDVVTPDKAIFNADWVCHHSCEQGVY